MVNSRLTCQIWSILTDPPNLPNLVKFSRIISKSCLILGDLRFQGQLVSIRVNLVSNLAKSMLNPRLRVKLPRFQSPKPR